MIETTAMAWPWFWAFVGLAGLPILIWMVVALLGLINDR